MGPEVDIYKLKWLFNCTNTGKQGTLIVEINVTAKLNTDYYSDMASARATVIVTAKKDDQTETQHNTVSEPTSNPVWNQELRFGSASWQSVSIRIRVVPHQAGKVNKETPRQLFYVNYGEHDLDRCDESSCNGIKLSFEYELKHSRDPCNPNPCKNGGTCRFGDITDYSCYCPADRYEIDCDIIMLLGNLTVYILNGTDLPTNAIDLRVKITAYNDATNSFAQQFVLKDSTKWLHLSERNPEWFA